MGFCDCHVERSSPGYTTTNPVKPVRDYSSEYNEFVITRQIGPFYDVTFTMVVFSREDNWVWKFFMENETISTRLNSPDWSILRRHICDDGLFQGGQLGMRWLLGEWNNLHPPHYPRLVHSTLLHLRSRYFPGNATRYALIPWRMDQSQLSLVPMCQVGALLLRLCVQR